MRIALSLGLNRNTYPNTLSPQQYQHRIKLWWSLYVLERKLSALMGAPLSLDDEKDINAPLPDTLVGTDLTMGNEMLTLNVLLSSLLGKVINSKIINASSMSVADV